MASQPCITQTPRVSELSFCQSVLSSEMLQVPPMRGKAVILSSSLLRRESKGSADELDCRIKWDLLSSLSQCMGRKLWPLKESLAVFSLLRSSYGVHKMGGMQVSCMCYRNEHFSVTRCLSCFISTQSRRTENHRKIIKRGLHYMQPDGTIRTTLPHSPNRFKSLSSMVLA